MNRKTKNILFWIIAGILIALFVITLFLGIVNSFAGAGTEIYTWNKNIIKALGLTSEATFDASPFICVGCGCVLSFMLYKKYNTRIN